MEAAVETGGATAGLIKGLVGPSGLSREVPLKRSAGGKPCLIIDVKGL